MLSEMKQLEIRHEKIERMKRLMMDKGMDIFLPDEVNRR
jgi:hypothetical protein